jgi:hypothetical protein
LISIYFTIYFTCDWPRNVNQLFCNSTIPQINREHIYKPIKIESNYDLSTLLKTRTNNEADEGSRSGRSYAQSGPELKYDTKENLQGRYESLFVLTITNLTYIRKTKKRARYKRQILANFLDKIGLLKKVGDYGEGRDYKSSMYPAAHYNRATYGSVKYHAPVQINFRSRPHLVNSHIKLKLNLVTTVRPVRFVNKPIVLKRPNLAAFTTTTTIRPTTTKNLNDDDSYYYYDDDEPPKKSPTFPALQ